MCSVWRTWDGGASPQVGQSCVVWCGVVWCGRLVVEKRQLIRRPFTPPVCCICVHEHARIYTHKQAELACLYLPLITTKYHNVRCTVATTTAIQHMATVGGKEADQSFARGHLGRSAICL